MSITYSHSIKNGVTLTQGISTPTTQVMRLEPPSLSLDINYGKRLCQNKLVSKIL